VYDRGVRRVAWLIALCALPACYPKGDDPYGDVSGDPCSPGNVRNGNAWCAAPVAPIVIDGDVSDWAGVEAIPLAQKCLVPPCEGYAADQLQFARATDADGKPVLAFRVRLAGGETPREDTPYTRYVISLSDTPDYPVRVHDDLIAGGGIIELEKNGYVTRPPASQTYYALAWTADGYELSVRTDYVPYPFGARIAVRGLTSEGPNWQDAVDPTPVARACWYDGFQKGSHLDDWRGDPCRKVDEP
jgi:hypothetical protein